MKIQAVIFDCFGVLYPDTFWAMVHKFVPEWETTDPERFHDIVTRVDSGLIDRNEFWDETAAACGVTREVLDAAVKQLGAVDKELLRYITDLRTRRLKIGVLSNVGRGFFEKMFEQLTISDYFDDLVLSSEVGMVKPDHEIFELAAERLQVRTEECVFIDDRERFCTAAEATGMKAIEYKSLEKLKRDLEPLL